MEDRRLSKYVDPGALRRQRTEAMVGGSYTYCDSIIITGGSEEKLLSELAINDERQLHDGQKVTWPTRMSSICPADPVTSALMGCPKRLSLIKPAVVIDMGCSTDGGYD